MTGSGPVTGGYQSWPAPARAMALAVDAAVRAAQAGDAPAFAGAAADLSRADPDQLLVLLGTVTRDLLERSHPDGLDADDAEQVLQSCITSAAPWYEQADAGALIVALTGALGISEPDDPAPRPDGAAVVAHGLLLIADQLKILAQRLAPVLDFALRELMRAQTVELP